MKILITVPDLKLSGGVANHYMGLRDYWHESVKYIVIGRKKGFPFSGIFWLPFDSIKYLFLIYYFRPDLIVINPSFDKTALYRDSYFFRLALLCKQKVILFFHGWNIKYSESVSKQNIIPLFNSALCILVLASEFKKLLEAWGVTIPVYLTSTKVDDKLIQNFNENKYRNGKINTLLFLSRIIKEKGIFIAINAFQILKVKYPYLKMNIVGDGKALNDAKEFVAVNNIKDILFTGNLYGENLITQFMQSDIYIFPSLYSEGMPTSVLETMAFALPVITRPVGGLVDFFENGKMGEMIDSLNPHEFADVIEKYILDEYLTQKTSLYNYTYAKEHFMASNVAKKLEIIFAEILSIKNVKK